MYKKISSLILILVLASCSTIKEKMPKRKACTNDSNKTLADLICKK
tara:strand:+ start:77 stop:214 length:138 start_codon:yes stop_codon:yes gene_type:complete